MVNVLVLELDGTNAGWNVIKVKQGKAKDFKAKSLVALWNELFTVPDKMYDKIKNLTDLTAGDRPVKRKNVISCIGEESGFIFIQQ